MTRMQSSVEQLIRQRHARDPDEAWLFFKDETYTWRDVIRLSQKAANGLLRLGVGPGDAVAIMAGNKPGFLWLYFGMLMIGASVVPLNRWQRGPALRHMLKDSAATAIVFDEELREAVMEVRMDCPDLRRFVVFGAPSDGVDASYEQLMDAPDGEPEVEVSVPSNPIGILYTSGTTGPPKGIVAERFVNALGPLYDSTGVRPGETMYTCLPLIHGNALFISTIGSIRLGARLALAERFSASRFWDDCRRYNAVHISTLGGILPLLMKQPPRADDHDNPVRVALSVGCPATMWRAFEERFGVRIVEFYGMSDAPGQLLNTEGKVGSVGKPAGSAEFRIVDSDDNPLPPGTPGQIVFRDSIGQTTRYNNLPEATAEAWRGGWFHSGDLGEMDAEGFFYFRGRMKEAIRRRGENISAWEIESVIDQHPAVVESAAFGIPSDLGDEDVAVAVVLQPGQALPPEELLAFCRGRLAYYAVPRYIDFVDALPKTGTQKIRKGALKERGKTAAMWDREAHGIDVMR